MGLPGMGNGAKMDMNAVNRHMQQNLRAARMRDWMRTKLQEKEKEGESSGSGVSNNNITENLEDMVNREELIKSLGLNLEGMEELIYSTGEKVEKSNRPLNKKKKKGHKKKK